MVDENSRSNAGFDPIKMQEAEASIFSSYLTAIEMYVSDLKKLADREGAIITKDPYTDNYYLQSVPTTDPQAYDTNGKKEDITYHSLLTGGKSCLFMGHAGCSGNTGDNGGHYWGLHVEGASADNLLAVFFKERSGSMPSFKVMNSHHAYNGEITKHRFETVNDVEVDGCGGDSTLNGVFAPLTRFLYSPDENVRVTGSVYPLTSTAGWDERNDWFKDVGRRLKIHDPKSGATFSGCWFVPNTYNGKWNIGKRMSPLCACLSAVLSNVSLLGNGKICVSEIPRLDENLVIKQSLSVGKSVASLFANPISVVGGNEVVYTYRKTVDASAWVNFIKELNFRDANNSPIELFARVDQAYIEDYKDVAVSMPYLICTNVLNGQKYDNVIMLDDTFLVAPDFMLLDSDVQDVLTALTIDDLCYLALRYGSTSSLNLVCGIDNATCTYSVDLEDVTPYLTIAGNTVIQNVEKIKNRLSGYLSDSAIRDVCAAYSEFFFHVLSARQCGKHIVLLSHNQVLMSKNQIMAEYEKTRKKDVYVENLNVSGVYEDSKFKNPLAMSRVFTINNLSVGGENEEEVH